MKILVIHQQYLFSGQPGGSRFNEMARLWSEAGHEVTIIAGALNYATGDQHPEFGRRWCTRSVEGPVMVWRCYVPGTYNTSYVGRVWAHVGFAAAASWAALRVSRPDVVIATSPPLTIIFPAWVAAMVRHRHVPWVFEIRDLWPESAVTTGVLSRHGLLTSCLYRVERWACRHATLVNVLTPAFRENLLRRALAADEKISLIPNGADTAIFFPGPRDNAARHAFGWGDRNVVLYAGAHGRANAIGQLVDAAERLVHRPDILIATVGDGPERERWAAHAKHRGLANIEFLGPQPKELMADIISAADIGAAILQDNPTFRTVYPNKVFDYMACGRPVLLAIDGVARKLVCDEARAGVFAEPERPERLAAAIEHLANDPGLRAELGGNGRRWVLANATREALAHRYLAVLKKTVEPTYGLAAT